MIKSSHKSKKEKVDVQIPPSIVIPVTSDMIFRFIKTGSNTANIQGPDFGKLLVMAVSGTNGYTLYESIRPIKICAYGPASVLTSATGYANTVVSLRQVSALASLTSAGLPGSTERCVSSYPTGAQGAYCKFKFRSPNNFWYEPFTLNYTTTVFQITGPIGTIVDLHCVIRMFNTPNAANLCTSTAATTGAIYYNYFDTNSQQLQSAAQNNGKVWA